MCSKLKIIAKCNILAYLAHFAVHERPFTPLPCHASSLVPLAYTRLPSLHLSSEMIFTFFLQLLSFSVQNG